jgi:hypothetical protein
MSDTTGNTRPTEAWVSDLRGSVGKLAVQYRRSADEFARLAAEELPRGAMWGQRVIDVLDEIHTTERREHSYVSDMVYAASRADIARAEAKAADQ